jgi:uncharacterized tellurite resistance protein B-like protein
MSINPTDQEDAYFRKQDQELRQRLRDQLSSNASTVGQAPRELPIAERLAGLGFSGERSKIFDLMPLVHVAWADGSVSRQERTAILDLLKGRGIEPGSEAFLMMETLLEARPSNDFLTQTLALLKEVVGDARSESIVELCLQIANASGGFMNIGKVSDAERRQIEAIAQALGPAAKEALYRELG